VTKACDAISRRLSNGEGQTIGQSSANPASSFNARFGKLGVGAIEEYAEFLPPGAPPDAIEKLYQGKPSLGGGSMGDKLKYALGAEFVEVRIHARTREIRVSRLVGAFAAGRIMNTRTARSQYTR
jgi:xanthine dehydrogenase YagR molybdenum-binding subunit